MSTEVSKGVDYIKFLERELRIRTKDLTHAREDARKFGGALEEIAERLVELDESDSDDATDFLDFLADKLSVILNGEE